MLVHCVVNSNMYIYLQYLSLNSWPVECIIVSCGDVELLAASKQKSTIIGEFMLLFHGFLVLYMCMYSPLSQYRFSFGCCTVFSNMY